MTETALWPSVQRDTKSAEFFDAAAQRELLIKQCTFCLQATPSEAVVCSACGETALEWIRASGSGSLVSWTVVHRAPGRAYADLVPYVIGIVELDEGPWMYARLAVEAPAPGLPLLADFVSNPDGETYPVFVEREEGR